VALVRIARVSDTHDTAPDSAAALSADVWRSLHEARVRAELAAADALAPGSDAVRVRGALLADVAVVKGLAGPAEAAGDPALSDADGVALALALVALGHSLLGVFYTLSRPEPGIDPARRAERLRLQLEAVDPALVIALDAEAAADLAEAFGTAAFVPGQMVRVLGRRVVALEGFEASLGDAKRKRRAWEQLKAARAEGAVY